MISHYSLRKFNYAPKIFLFISVFTISVSKIQAQGFWNENFGSTLPGACDQGNLADLFTTANGTWTVADVQTPDTAANEWYISAAEPGFAAGSCASPGCFINPVQRKRTLHVGTVPNSPNAGGLCPTGDCGAVYDAGTVLSKVKTSKRAQSPVIDCTGKTGILLTFNYFEHGDAANNDNTTLQCFNGTSWLLLPDPPRTDTLCGATAGHWKKYSTPLPASVFNNPNVQIGFLWQNDTIGTGVAISFAVDSISLSLNQPPVAEFGVSDTEICSGTCINFSDSSTNSPSSWVWSFPGGVPSSSTLQNPGNICYPFAGTYDVQLLVSSAAGTDSVLKSNFITVNSCSPPVANIYSDSTNFCERYCTNFSDTSLNVPTAWIWRFPGGIPDSSTARNPSHICYYTPGTYSVTLIVYNQYGNDSITIPNYITVNSCPLPIADFTSTNTAICSNRCINFTDLTTYNPIAWSWYFPGAVPDTSTRRNPTGICYPNDGFYDVTLIATNQYGSDTMTKISYIKVESVPFAFASPDTAMFFGSSYQLNAGGGMIYMWSPWTGLDTNGIPNPVASPLTSTTYTVSITDSSGCTTVRQVTITILHNNDTFVPNSFAPDGGGANTRLHVYGNNLYGIRFTVFDRWGEKVFETNSQDIGWDGTYKGKELGPAVFTYVLTVNYNDGKTKTETGTVTLVR